MALDLNERYQAQADSTDPGYPYGKARNASSPNDGTGFPLEKDWPNDIFGLLQSLLTEAAIEPSETPDKVGASQYLQALETLFYRRSLIAPTQLAWFAITGSAANASRLGLTKRGEIGGSFSVASNEAIVPAAATYLAIAKGELQAADSTNGVLYGMGVEVTGSGQSWGGRAYDYRRSTQDAEAIHVCTFAIVTVTDVGTDKIRMTAVNFGSGNVTALSATPDPCSLLLLRLSPP